MFKFLKFMSFEGLKFMSFSIYYSYWPTGAYTCSVNNESQCRVRVLIECTQMRFPSRIRCKGPIHGGIFNKFRTYFH